MKLVDNWKQCWKWLSLHCMISATTIQALVAAIKEGWISIPDDLKSLVPHNLATIITIILLALGIIGRFINQTPDIK